MMRFMLISIVALAGSVAMANPSTTDMTCDQARTTVEAAGAIVLGTGGYTYDRFVSSAAYCQPGQVTAPAWAPTLDSNACFIGYTCEDDRNAATGGVRGPAGTCTEGYEQMIWNAHNPHTSTPIGNLFVCRDGMMVRADGKTASPAPAPVACTEGHVQVIYEQNSYNDTTDAVQYVCRGGVYERMF